MNRRDRLSGIFWLAISIFVCVLSIRVDIGTFHSPGPGFLPFWAALILGTFSIVQIVVSSKNRNWEEKIIDLWKGLDWPKVVKALLSVFLYPLLLPILGYLLATFLLIAFLIGITGRTKVWIQGVSAFLIVLGSYFVFYILLDIRLPKGVLGF